MTKDRVAEYLQSEAGKSNAERFLKAVKEHRLLCSVKHVSRNGMSRIIGVYEIQHDDNGRPYLCQFNWFLGEIGFKYNDDYHAIRVGGCGMDMIYNLLYNAVDKLRYYGMEVEPRLEFETNRYMSV